MISNELLKQRINQTGRRLTNQRMAILAYLQSVTCHPTAEKIYLQVKGEIPAISLGTVYRNLNYLVKEGYIIQFQNSDNITCYDGNPKNHIHFICESCDEVSDIFNEPIINDKALKKIGQATTIECKIFGRCSKCLNKNK